jgi:hypothetical protein
MKTPKRNNFSPLMHVAVLLYAFAGFLCGAEKASSPDVISLTTRRDGSITMDGNPAGNPQLGQAIANLVAGKGSVLLHREPGQWLKLENLSEILEVIAEHRVPFSIVTDETPTNRELVSGPMLLERDKVAGKFFIPDFAALHGDECPVHHGTMKKQLVPNFRDEVKNLIPRPDRETVRAKFPFSGISERNYWVPYSLFPGRSVHAFVCPACLAELKAWTEARKKEPLIIGKWTTYVAIPAVPPDLWRAFQRQILSRERIADAGQAYAFGCVSFGDEPRRGFLLAGTCEDAGFVIYRQGGFTTSTKAAIFRKVGSDWIARHIGPEPLGADLVNFRKNDDEADRPELYVSFAEAFLGAKSQK